jgi:hypothetical protein
LRKAESIGPATHQLVRELLVDQALHHLRQAQGVLRLVDRFGDERLECACRRALDAGDGRYRTVRGILERGIDEVQPEDEVRTILRPIGAFLRGPAAFARSFLEARWWRRSKRSNRGSASSSSQGWSTASPLNPLDFLLLLRADELMRRESESIDRYIHRAHFDEVCDLRDFDFTYNPQIPKARIWEPASGRFVEERASILLSGPTGVGKTFIAQGARCPDLPSAASRRVRQDQRVPGGPGRWPR